MIDKHFAFTQFCSYHFQEKDLEKIKDFLSAKKPHVVAVAATSREVLMVMEDIKAVLTELEQEEQMPPINVELVDNELAMVYSNCKKSEVSYRTGS